MEEKQTKLILKMRTIELEEKLMDVIVLSSRYDNIPVPMFEEEKNALLREIEHLERLYNSNSIQN